MDPCRFDALTKSLGQVRSRRTLLRTLGAATFGAVGLAGTGRAVGAAGSTCGEAYDLCSARARDTLYAAHKACQAGPREAEEACTAAAIQTFNAAIDVCRDQYNDCRFPPPPVCKDNGSLCTVDRECCSLFCLVFVCAG